VSGELIGATTKQSLLPEELATIFYDATMRSLTTNELFAVDEIILLEGSETGLLAVALQITINNDLRDPNNRKQMQTFRDQFRSSILDRHSHEVDEELKYTGRSFLARYLHRWAIDIAYHNEAKGLAQDLGVTKEELEVRAAKIVAEYGLSNPQNLDEFGKFYRELGTLVKEHSSGYHLNPWHLYAYQT